MACGEIASSHTVLRSVQERTLLAMTAHLVAAGSRAMSDNLNLACFVMLRPALWAEAALSSKMGRDSSALERAPGPQNDT